jgi:conjugal transfer/type IV secretion protein DotA/TraY
MQQAHAESRKRGREVLKYLLLPQVIPRLIAMFRRGFGNLASYIAMLFGALRILPPTHPYLKSENYGSYGLIAVLYTSAKHVTWDKKHLDQVFVYCTVIIGMAAFLLQLISLVTVLLMPQAFAGSANLIEDTDNWENFFTPEQTEQDYALRFLDLVFGLPADSSGQGGMYFQSCLGNQGGGCLGYDGEELDPYPYTNVPFPIHRGIHSLLEFYNYTIIAIGFIIAFYYIVTLLAETTVSGVFLGERANKIWIPVRVVFFAALIMPFFQGLNLGQILVLNAGYYGTGLASNAWRNFMEVVQERQAGELETLLATPSEFPSVIPLYKFMVLAKACNYAEEQVNNRIIEGYLVRNAVLGERNCRSLSGEAGFSEMLEFAQNQDIHIRFGERARLKRGVDFSYTDTIDCTETDMSGSRMQDKYVTQLGNVIPYCGELVIDISGAADNDDFIAHNYSNILNFWQDPYVDELAKHIVDLMLNNREGNSVEVLGLGNLSPEELTEALNSGALTDFNFPDMTGTGDMRNPFTDPTPNDGIDNLSLDFSENGIRSEMRYWEALQQKRLAMHIENIKAEDFINIPDELANCGWLCAAIYYNRIAEVNGDLVSDLFKTPTVQLWPSVMEDVREQLTQDGTDVPYQETFGPILAGGRVLESINENDLKVATVLDYVMHEFWSNDIRMSNDYSDMLAGGTALGGDDVFRPTMAAQSNNPVLDFISALFGINGLFDMRQNYNIHPLAQLSALGKGMVEATIRSFGFAVGGSILALGMEQEESLTQVSELIKGPIVSVLTTVGMVTLVMGFLLYYVLPFLPFLYFFFAAGAWVTAMFEAIIGVPLWALAHMRIDGEGIPGRGGEGGWFLILEILLRPILILVGLIASISVFAALVRVLNEIFDLVVANVGGFNAADAWMESEDAITAETVNQQPFTIDKLRGPIDQLFYTVMYAIIVYMMAMASFKAIDAIPNYILRWMNVSVKTFAEFAGDPAGELMGKIGQGLTMVSIMGTGMLGSITKKDYSDAADG